MPARTLYEYAGTVVRWIDGDTAELTLDLGFHVSITDHFRISGIDTPERGQPGAAEATARARELAPPGERILVRTTKGGEGDKYGRWLAIVIEETGLDVGETLHAEGLARAYTLGGRSAG